MRMMSNPAEEEFFAIEGRPQGMPQGLPLDYDVVIEELENERHRLSIIITALTNAKHAREGRKAPQRVEGISA